MIKKFIFSIVLFSMSAFVLLAAAEILLRAKERKQMAQLKASDDKSVLPSDIPGLNYTLAPGHYKDGIIFNSHGFNMPERNKKRTENTLRILFVGDSVTQGVGTKDTDEAYPNRVNEILKDATQSESIDVWNCGTGGYNAQQVLIQMREILPPYQPDVIVYGFNFNDYWASYQFFHGQPGLPPEQNAKATNEGMLDILKKFRVVLKARDTFNDIVYRARGYSPVYVDQKVEYPSWVRMKITIRDMHDYCQSHGIGFVVVIHPNEQFFYRTEQQNVAHSDIKAHLSSEKIEHFDLLPALLPHKNKDIFLKDGNHMTPLGYDLAANAVADFILSRTDLFQRPRSLSKP